MGENRYSTDYLETKRRDNQLMAGYSGTPLPKKLGIKEGMTVGILSDLPDGVETHTNHTPSDIFVVRESPRLGNSRLEIELVR
jgi:hypothetical protein